MDTCETQTAGFTFGGKLFRPALEATEMMNIHADRETQKSEVLCQSSREANVLRPICVELDEGAKGTDGN